MSDHRLPSNFFVTRDPVGKNPFPVRHPLHKVWSAATREAKGLSEARRPLDTIEDARLMKFMLPGSEAKQLLSLLSFDGVSAATIFPGYGGVVESLKDAAQWGSASPT